MCPAASGGRAATAATAWKSARARPAWWLSVTPRSRPDPGWLSATRRGQSSSRGSGAVSLTSPSADGFSRSQSRPAGVDPGSCSSLAGLPAGSVVSAVPARVPRWPVSCLCRGFGPRRRLFLAGLAPACATTPRGGPGVKDGVWGKPGTLGHGEGCAAIVWAPDLTGLGPVTRGGPRGRRGCAIPAFTPTPGGTPRPRVRSSTVACANSRTSRARSCSQNGSLQKVTAQQWHRSGFASICAPLPVGQPAKAWPTLAVRRAPMSWRCMALATSREDHGRNHRRESAVQAGSNAPQSPGIAIYLYLQSRGRAERRACQWRGRRGSPYFVSGWGSGA
jgi:hypothetical protein